MIQNKPQLLLILVSIICFSSCIERAYFHSPIQGNTSAYHAMPLASDSVKAATYLNSLLSIGNMNENLRDQVFSFQAGVHRGHVLDHFRLNYGASLALGTYDVHSYYSYYNNSSYTGSGGTRFFGAYGAFGGISATTPMGRRGEWRFLGVEGNIFHEFGEYYDFRKIMPDSQATEIDRKNYLGSAGINTELVFKGQSQNKFGIKLAFGSYFRRLHYVGADPGDYYHQYNDLLYFANTYHFSFKKNTVYFQFNSATHAVHFQLGYNYRL